MIFRDLRSTNGTFQNGERKDEGQATVGDTLRFGGNNDFSFFLSNVANEDLRPPDDGTEIIKI